MSGCQQPIDMPICKHMRPVKFGCPECNPPISINLSDLIKRIEQIEEYLRNIDHLIVAAQNAQALFAQKVHDLKSIDQKRDDVINALCQKVERTNSRIDALASLLGVKVDN